VKWKVARESNSSAAKLGKSGFISKQMKKKKGSKKKRITRRAWGKSRWDRGARRRWMSQKQNASGKTSDQLW